METHLEALNERLRWAACDHRRPRRSRVMQISAPARRCGSLEAAPTTAACDGVYRLGRIAQW